MVADPLLADAYRLLRRAREFVGVKTSLEQQQPIVVPGIYVTPVSEGDSLREQAAKADRRDALILAIRDFLKKDATNEQA